MSARLTFRALERAGNDAGALLDAYESELRFAIPMGASKADRRALAADLKRVQELRDAWFGAAA